MTGYSPRRRGSILSDMADIAQDLWASVPETVPAEKPTAVRDEPTAPQAPQTAQNPAKSADSAPKATYADEKSLPFTELWKVADEPIDWTEVLSSPIPTDGLVSAEKWAIYRQYADKVLSGDTAAYLGVLKAVDPMRDLAPYTSSALRCDARCGRDAGNVCRAGRPAGQRRRTLFVRLVAADRAGLVRDAARDARHRDRDAEGAAHQARRFPAQRHAERALPVC